MEYLRREINIFPGFDYQKALLSPNNEALTLENYVRKGVAQFLENEPDFEFADTHLDSYLSEHTATAFKGIPEEYRNAVTTQLKALQRVFRVSPNYEHLQVLNGRGIAFSI